MAESCLCAFGKSRRLCVGGVGSRQHFAMECSSSARINLSMVRTAAGAVWTGPCGRTQALFAGASERRQFEPELEGTGGERQSPLEAHCGYSDDRESTRVESTSGRAVAPPEPEGVVEAAARPYHAYIARNFAEKLNVSAASSHYPATRSVRAYPQRSREIWHAGQAIRYQTRLGVSMRGFDGPVVVLFAWFLCRCRSDTPSRPIRLIVTFSAGGKRRVMRGQFTAS